MLRLIRQDPALRRFDPRFFEKSPHFEPIAGAARTFADATDWPSVDDYNRLDVPVRFVAQPPAPRRGVPEVRWARDLYDARIVRGEVPTRPGVWHDFLNALVWATFPRSKLALHTRQHAVIEAWLRDRGAVDAEGRVHRLPGSRTREHDALALIDEGGIVMLGDRPVVFGHALYEGLVLGTRSMIARAVPVLGSSADEALAARLQLPLTPEDLPRRPL